MSVESTALSDHETRAHRRRSAMPRRTYSLDEVSEMLGLSRNRTFAAAREGQLPVPIFKIGNRFFVSRALFDRFLETGDLTARSQDQS